MYDQGILLRLKFSWCYNSECCWCHRTDTTEARVNFVTFRAFLSFFFCFRSEGMRDAGNVAVVIIESFAENTKMTQPMFMWYLWLSLHIILLLFYCLEGMSDAETILRQWIFAVVTLECFVKVRKITQPTLMIFFETLCTYYFDFLFVQREWVTQKQF